MKVIIRRAIQSDKKSLQELSIKLIEIRKNLFSSANKRFHQKNGAFPSLPFTFSPKNIIFVAELQGLIIGFIRGSTAIRKKYILSKLGSVDNLYVDEHYQNQRIGKKLFDALCTEFKAKKCDHVTLHADSENKRAHSFYSACKMNPVTVEFWKAL